MRIIFQGKSPYRGWWRWPWLHFCLWDKQCQSLGCPKDIYIHPLRIIIRFKEWEE